MRELYQSFINHLHPSDDDNISTTILAVPKDDSFEERQLNMRARYIYASQVNLALLDTLTKLEDVKELPVILILGFTYRNFLASNVTDELIKQFTDNITRLVVPFDQLVAQKTKVLWKLQDRINEEKVAQTSWKSVLNDDIDRLNQAALSVFRYSDAVVWKAAWQIANGLVDSAVNGFRVSDLGLRHEVQILINMYCNDYMNYNDGTCCASAEPFTTLQIVSYAIFGVW